MLQESIYNIIPESKRIPGKDSLYKSTYPYWIVPTGTTFNLRNCSYPNVANLSGDYTFPRGGHPVLRSSAHFGRAEGYKPDPLNFHKKGDTGKILPPLERLHTSTEVRKPPVPTLNDKPITGLKTDKNYIISNAVDSILMEPKKLPEEKTDIYRHRSFGKVPNYIKNYRLKAEQEFETIREIKRRKKEEEDRKQRLLTEEEVTSLREGLKKKWEIYNRRYAKLTHKKAFDNLVLLRNKESLEKELEQIEGDLKKLDSKHVIIDYTK